MNNNNPNMTSFLRLRKYIGVLGFTLPLQIICMAGLLSSISYSYYTAAHDLFVGNLVAIGLFLFCDKGYKGDALFNRIAGIAAVLVALNPCESGKVLLWVKQSDIHYTAAAVLFLTLGYISAFRFTKHGTCLTEMKHKRNKIYKVCGYLIFGSVILIPVALHFNKAIFTPESIGITSPFGFAWLVKGETILKDR